MAKARGHEAGKGSGGDSVGVCGVGDIGAGAGGGVAVLKSEEDPVSKIDQRLALIEHAALSLVQDIQALRKWTAPQQKRLLGDRRITHEEYLIEAKVESDSRPSRMPTWESLPAEIQNEQ